MLYLAKALLEKTAAQKFKCIKSRDKLLTICESSYYTNGLKDLKNIPSKSIDHIFSQTVLEHIRKDDFVNTISELFQITKKWYSLS